MYDLNLAVNEGIILQFEDASHNHRKADIFLTNMNIICVENNIGFFKTNYNILKFPVNQIKNVDGKVQASVIKEGDKTILQILFRDNIEKFVFARDFFESLKFKKEADKWVKELNVLLTGKQPEIDAGKTIMGSVKNVLDTIGVTSVIKEQQNITKKCIGCKAPLNGKKGDTVSCPYCDTKQTL